MFLFRKNIILVPSDYDGVSMQKGILCMDCFNGMSKCSLKCYNVDITKELVLGVCIDGKLTKFDIEMSKTKSFEFVIKDTVEHTSEVSAVLLDIGKDDYSIVLWGSTQINLAWQNTLKEMIEENYVKQVSDHDYNESYDNEIKSQQLDKIADYCNFDKNNDDGCNDQKQCGQNGYDKFETEYHDNITEDEKLDNFIDSVIKMTEDDEDEQEGNNTQTKVQMAETNFDNVVDLKNNFLQSEDTENKRPKMHLNFYDKLSGQIQKMFDANESFEVLNEIFPNSKFCKVNFDDGSGYYAFGIIYDEGQAKYLCYGMPAQKDDAPPKEFAELYQWLPVDTSSEDGDGFYMMYQDAETGKNISVDII